MKSTWLKRQRTEGLFLLKIKDSEDKRRGNDKQGQKWGKIMVQSKSLSVLKGGGEISFLNFVFLPLMNKVIAYGSKASRGKTFKSKQCRNQAILCLQTAIRVCKNVLIWPDLVKSKMNL